MNSLRKIGDVPAVHSSSVKHSSWGLGFEKLDRAVFDPAKAYDKVAALGVKHIRIQSGWARTEQKKGIYDFTWLDSVVDNLLRRGLMPWLCLCYGNGVYDEAAAKVFGAVGCPPIHTEEQKKAWHDYVVALVTRYKGKIGWYEVWNEPDGKWCWKHGVNGTEYGEFVNATAKAVREADPDAKVFTCHQRFLAESIERRFQKTFLSECFQVVYTKKSPLPGPEGIAVRTLGEEYTDLVHSLYPLIEKRERVREILGQGILYGAFLPGEKGEELAGFIGTHEEGSMGILHVLEKFRHRGIAQQLERFLINRLLEQGKTPYGHIFTDNLASLQLQKKMGFRVCPGKIYWIS